MLRNCPYWLQGSASTASLAQNPDSPDLSRASLSLFNPKDKASLKSCHAGLLAIQNEGGDKILEEACRQRISTLQKNQKRSFTEGLLFFVRIVSTSFVSRLAQRSVGQHCWLVIAQ